MDLAVPILVLAAVAFIGALPWWPHSRHWGYGPAAVIGTVLLILLVLTVTGNVPSYRLGQPGF